MTPDTNYRHVFGANKVAACGGDRSSMIAALDALDAADTASDPVIVEAYARIARDEQRHAELAFRFVRWALAQDAGMVTPRLLAALAKPPSAHPAAQEVVLPCLRELLALATSASGRKDPVDTTLDAAVMKTTGLPTTCRQA